MSNLKLRLLIIINLTFFNIVCFAQNKFSVTVEFPDMLYSKNISVSYNNGKIIKKIDLPMENKITISDTLYSKYAIIKVTIDSNNFCKRSTTNTFYITKKQASVTFTSLKYPNENTSQIRYKLTNVYNADTIANQFYLYTAVERNKLNDFAISIEKKDSINARDFAMNKLLVKNLISKEMRFIKKNKTNYFSFQVFKNEIAPNIFANPDSTLHFYKNIFPANLRNTPEGKEIMKILTGRKIASSEGIQAPDFKLTDINGKRIELKDYKGKYVLINFWASWCVPCIAELPSIKKISNQYFPEKLIIITNTIDKDTLAFLAAIKKYGMSDWINVYNSTDLEKKFGGVTAIPQLFLIDPKGKIVYNRNFNPIDNNTLTRLNQILKKDLQ